ncbi:hypothetical protein OH77DRAFT_1521722 [Trametes cingulata]|nr:hypothetical protein OH77DRAFT_1521722 [Trametes cingulata]
MAPDPDPKTPKQNNPGPRQTKSKQMSPALKQKTPDPKPKSSHAATDFDLLPQTTVSMANGHDVTTVFNPFQGAIQELNNDFFQNIGDEVRRPLRMLEEVARNVQPDLDYKLGHYIRK